MTALGLRSPVLVAAGCGGTGLDLLPYGDPATLGGFVTRSLTLRPRTGGGRIEEAASGLVHALGMPNPGVEAFVRDELPPLVERGVAVVVSIAGATLGEYAELARTAGRAAGVAGLELNVSAPDATGTGVLDVREPFHAASVTAAARRDLPSGVLLLAKVRTDPGRVVELARTVLEAGADAVVVGNALPAALPDGRAAGLSGPAIRPLALRCVAEVRAALPDAAVVGCGGIMDAADARAFLAAGASAVQVGTAVLHDPTTPFRIAHELSHETPGVS